MRHLGTRGRSGLSTLASRRALAAAAAVGGLSVGVIAAPTAAVASPNLQASYLSHFSKVTNIVLDRPCQRGRESLRHRRRTSDCRKAGGG